jgi:ribosomal-protein-alanine N-acetyltransferase
VNKTLVGRFNWVGSDNTGDKTGQGESVEVGYRMGERFGGQGFATQGLELLIELARKQGTQTLNAVTTETNVGSSRVLTKLGFKQNGIMVDAAELNGERVNLVRYQRFLA